VTALLSRVINPRERGLYMGMQQTYGGVARALAPLFFGWSFDKLGVSSPYLIASAFILATIFLSPDVAHVSKKAALPEQSTENA
jgi:MFS family permease